MTASILPFVAARRLPRCPDWCDLHSMHEWDSFGDRDRALRGHGHWIGQFVDIFAMEYQDTPGVLVELSISVSPEVERYVTDPETARRLADDLIKAADWWTVNA